MSEKNLNPRESPQPSAQSVVDRLKNTLFLSQNGSPYGDRVLNADAIDGNALQYSESEIDERRSKVRKLNRRLKLNNGIG